MRLMFFILFVLLSIGCTHNLNKEHPLYSDSNNVKTENHIRIKGTKLFAVIPDSFVYNQQAKTYSTKNQFIKFIQYPNISWSDIKKKNEIISIPMYGYEGSYFESEDLKSKSIDILVQFGGDDFVFNVSARTSTEIHNGRTELLNILQSLYYDEEYELDELELANFTIDRTFTDYKLQVGTSNVYMFSKGGNYISFESLLKISEQNLDKKINSILAGELKRGIRVKDRSIQKKIIGDYNVRILQTEIIGEPKSSLFCVAIISDINNAIVVTAFGSEDTDELKSIFDNIIRSIKFKDE